MSAVQAEVLERVFRVGSMILPDPDPSASPEQALAYYYEARPSLRHCTIGDPIVEDGRYVYPLHKPAATTKGGDGDADDEAASVNEALEQWAQSGEAASGDGQWVNAAWENAYPCLERMLKRPVAVEAFEARQIPLA